MHRSLLRSSLAAGLVCLAVILVFHSPRWWLLAQNKPGTMEWDRGLTYLRQCEAPFRSDVEPAVRWRFIPQVLVWATGGGTAVALAMPWIGACALLVYLHALLRRHGFGPAEAFYATTALGSSAPVFVSTGWLGMNDAWMALGLCYLAFGERTLLLAATCAVCPFVDERFVFGIPCALALRFVVLTNNASPRSLLRTAGYVILAIAPFAASRIIGALSGRNWNQDLAFWETSMRTSTAYLWMAPLGAWMAFRLAYAPAVTQALRLCETNRTAALTLGLTAVLPVTAGFLLASDTMRTAGILLPLCTWGAISLGSTARWKLIAFGNLLIPAAQVTYTKVVAINSLPVELWRLFRG